MGKLRLGRRSHTTLEEEQREGSKFSLPGSEAHAQNLCALKSWPFGSFSYLKKIQMMWEAGLPAGRGADRMAPGLHPRGLMSRVISTGLCGVQGCKRHWMGGRQGDPF